MIVMTKRILPVSLLLVSLASAALTAACSDGGMPSGTGGASGSGGSAPASGGSGSGDTTVPTDTTQAGLEAFLAAGSYKSAPWVFDAAIRTTTPHGDVRVYFNPTAVASIQAGTNTLTAPGNPLDTMVIKELYADGAQIGTAIMMRVDTTGTQSTDWLYYCASSDQAACADDGAGPIITGGGQCRFCHGGFIITELPPSP